MQREVSVRHYPSMSLVTLAEEVREGAGYYPRTLEQHEFRDPAGLRNSSLVYMRAEKKAHELRKLYAGAVTA